jgi:hypothetical protein
VVARARGVVGAEGGEEATSDSDSEVAIGRRCHMVTARQGHMAARRVLMTLASLKKLDYLVGHSEISGFSSFRAKPRKELNMKIQCVLKPENGLKGINGLR